MADSHKDEQGPYCCDMMNIHLRDGEVALRYSPKFRAYGIRVLDGGSSQIQIAFCPWCGARLPEDLSDAWFEAIEAMGLEPGDDEIPPKYQDDTWWRQAE